MNEPVEGLPSLPHVAGEFYTWLWWLSEAQDGVVHLGEELGPVDLWVDERLAFRNPNESKVLAVMTGDNPSTTWEARAALAGGKVLHELRLGIRREDREFRFTLRGPAMYLARVALPDVLDEGDQELVMDRMYLYEELHRVIGELFRLFAAQRASEGWGTEVLPRIQRWVSDPEFVPAG